MLWGASGFWREGNGGIGKGGEEVFAGLADNEGCCRGGVREGESEKLGGESWWEGKGLEWHGVL